MPAAFTTISASIAAAVGLHGAHPRRAASSIPVTRVRGSDPGAALPRAPAARAMGQAARVEVAIGRQPGGAQHAIGRHQRESVLRLAAADELHRPARTPWPSPPGGAAPPSAPARRPGAASRPRASRDRRRSRPPARGRWRRCRPSSGSGSGSTRSWPTRPAEWKVEPLVSSDALEQHDVGPAQAGQVVRDRRAAHAAADDHAPAPRSGTAAVALSHRAASRSARSKPGVEAFAQQPLEVLVGVGHEVDVERADRPAAARPTSPRGSRTRPASGPAAPAGGARTSPVVGRQQDGVLVGRSARG